MFLAEKDVSKRYNISISVLSKWINDKKFPVPVLLAGECIRWNIDDIKKWEALQQESPESPDLALRDKILNIISRKEPVLKGTIFNQCRNKARCKVQEAIKDLVDNNLVKETINTHTENDTKYIKYSLTSAD